LPKEGNGHSSQTLRLVIGNPIIMKKWQKRSGRSSLRATILIEERVKGGHLSHDSMERLIGSYEKNLSLSQIFNE
jgi:hypothetical protein